MTDNLALWKSVEKTDPSHVKAITGKSYQGTSPKPHYLVHKATETFGPIGIGWGFTIEDERIEEGAGGERMHIARVKVWFKWNGERGEVEHIGGTQFSGVRRNGNPFTDEDAPKKSVTDALVKALSMIGFAGDIFMGRYDDSKYVNDLRNEIASEKTGQEPRTTDRRSDAGRREVANKDRADATSDWLDKIAAADTMGDLQDLFASAWKATSADADRAKLKAEYEKRKTSLPKPSTDPTAQFDRMAEGEPA